MKNFLLLTLLILFTSVINTQVFHGNLNITTQAQVDTFNYTSVDGDLNIHNSNITNLDGLSELTSVTGGLDIWENQILENIDGMANLTSVGGDLIFYMNDVLENINGLSNLVYIGGRLGFSLNPAITNLNSLNKLTNVTRLSLIQNNSLLNIDGLQNITSVADEIFIRSNPSLENVDGLKNITSAKRLEITSNDALKNIDGLNSFMSVSTDLFIQDNIQLTNIDGLKNITNVPGLLLISGNRITNVHGLSGIRKTGSLRIGQNPLLFNLQGLEQLKTVEHDFSISYTYLHNIDALSNLEFVGENFSINDNLFLTNINGLSGLDSVNQRFFITNNTALTNISGLTNLKSVGTFFNIEYNPSLKIIDHLDSLTSVGLSLYITHNDSLTTITGFNNFLHVNYIYIWFNNVLKTIGNFPKLFSEKVSYHPLIHITYNPRLKEFCGFYYALTADNIIRFSASDNGANPTAQELIDGGPCDKAGQSFIAAMLGKNEVPEVQTSASGGGMFLLNETGDSLTFWIRVCNLSGDITGAHFHNAPLDSAGPIVKTISFTGDLAHAVWTSHDDQPLTTELRNELLNGNIYVNVHTALNPSGEIRGQIRSDRPVNLSADMSGAQEVPPNTEIGTGIGNFVLSGNGMSMYYKIDIRKLTGESKGTYFQNSPAGSNGPIVRTIPQDFEFLSLEGNWSNRSSEPLTPALVADILGCNVYANIVTSCYPLGEIRGQLYQEGTSGNTLPTSVVNKNEIPADYALEQNYPNPFNPVTTIRYSLPIESSVEIKIFNTLGEVVELLENSVVSAGNHNILFDGSKLSSGVYIYTLKAKAAMSKTEFYDVKKLLLLK